MISEPLKNFRWRLFSCYPRACVGPCSSNTCLALPLFYLSLPLLLLIAVFCSSIIAAYCQLIFFCYCFSFLLMYLFLLWY